MLGSVLATVMLMGASAVSVTPASAQGVDGLSTGRISLVPVYRLQVHEGGGLAINARLQNQQSKTQNFTVNYLGAAGYKAANSRGRLASREQTSEWVVTFLVGSKSVTDETIRNNVRLSCD
jgi:hypothetical protein